MLTATTPCRHRPATFLFTAALLMLAAPVNAAWPPDGLVISALSSSETDPFVVANSNGAVFLWADNRSGPQDVFCRFVDSTGTPTTGPLPIAMASSFQNGPVGFADGSGGAFVAWQDARAGNYDIYAQRVQGNGTSAWFPNGVAVTTAIGFQRFPAITGDGLTSTTGTLPGVWVAWQDDRAGTGDVFARHLGTGGPDGGEISVCFLAGLQNNVVMTGDGVSSVNVRAGAVLGWTDARDSADVDIYAQRLNTNGIPQWTAQGLLVCGAFGPQSELKVARIGQNYVFVWRDARFGSGRIYAQKLNVNGVPQWASDGMEVGSSANGVQSTPAIVPSADGSFIIAWSDTRNGNADIYAQRLDTNGASLWAVGGIPLCTASGAQTGPIMTTNANGVAVVSWIDERHSVDGDLYAQRVQSHGGIDWPSNGIAVCTAVGPQSEPRMVTSGSGAILTWKDERAGNNDVYGTRITVNALVDVPLNPPTPRFQLALRSPNPARGPVRIDLALAEPTEVDVTVYDLGGRRITSLLPRTWCEAGHRTLSWNGTDAAGAPLLAGLYLVRASAVGEVSTLKMVRLR